MKEKLGVKGLLKRSYNQLPSISEHLPHLPDIIIQTILEYQHNQRQANKTSTSSINSYNNKINNKLLGIGAAEL